MDKQNYEEEVLKFWGKNKIYEKVREKNKGKKRFYFLQGPPYSNGKIHIGTAWNNCLKDMIIRFFRMNGYDVWDRGGYDTHGLPTENKVQKNLNLKYKEDIEKFGVEKFIKECRKFSEDNAKIMSEDLKKLGVWMDFENAYMTLSNDYIEGEWFFIKKAWEQKRIYRDKKIIHWCANCETGLAKHELEYKNVKDDSIFLRFKVKTNTEKKKNEYLIVWTTTPWTIPFNLAVMVNPDLDYVKIETDDGIYITAKNLANILMTSVFEKKFKIIGEFKGKKLLGLEYEHPFHDELKNIYNELKKKHKNIHTVVLSKQYVDTTAGSGLVHCAPGCGPEDKEVGDEYKLPAFNRINEKGMFEYMNSFNGMTAKRDDNKFIELLDKKGSLMKKVEIEHEYPHCWRCHKPVVFRASEQWFLKIKDLIPKLVKENEKVLWQPKFGKTNYDLWMENLKDNSIVRQRYWGCPFPLWKCDKCNSIEIIGSIEELKQKVKKIPADLHKPFIDEVKWKCKCGGDMVRDSDILDVWIDSGTAGWNCLYYPSKNTYFKLFPADFILEATEQVRLWFSMLNICSMIALNKTSYKAVYMHGMVLDFQGTKMSKSMGNIISPDEVVKKAGVDCFRYYMFGNTAGENFNFNWEELKVKQRNLIILENIFNYLKDMASTYNLKFKNFKNKLGDEEKYMISRLNSTIDKVTKLFLEYRLDETVAEIDNLFLELSRTYIQMVREKISDGDEEDKQIVFDTIYHVLKNVLIMFSTTAPFITEDLWQEFREKFKEKILSVHLNDWPKADKKLIDEKLEKQFSVVKEVIEAGLAERDKVKINTRQPLSLLIYKTTNKENKEAVKNLSEIIKRQVNVKNIKPELIKKESETETTHSVALDVKLTPDLEAEGYSREIARRVQALRKKAGLVKTNTIRCYISSERRISVLLHKYNQIDWLKDRINANEIVFDKFSAKFNDKAKVKDFEVEFGFELE